MKNYLLNALPSDARQTFNTLMTSFEDIQEEVREDQRRQVLAHQLSTLETSVRRRYTESPEIRDTVATLVEQIAQQEGVEMVSTEGLGGLISGLFGGQKRPKGIPERQTWTAEHRAKIAKFLAELDKTYLNDGWLKKQKLVEGKVPAKDISIFFTVNNAGQDKPLYTMLVGYDSAEKFCRAWGQVLGGVDREVQAIKNRAYSGVKGKSDEEAFKIVEKAIEDFKAIKSPIDKLPKLATTGTRNMTITSAKGYIESVEDPVTQPVAEMPAASLEDIRKAAGIIRDILKDKKYNPVHDLYKFSWLDFEDGSQFSDWIHEANESLYDDFYDRFYFQNEPYEWIVGLYELFDPYKQAVALIKWIDRSIK